MKISESDLLNIATSAAQFHATSLRFLGMPPESRCQRFDAIVDATIVGEKELLSEAMILAFLAAVCCGIIDEIERKADGE